MKISIPIPVSDSKEQTGQPDPKANGRPVSRRLETRHNLDIISDDSDECNDDEEGDIADDESNTDLDDEELYQYLSSSLLEDTFSNYFKENTPEPLVNGVTRIKLSPETSDAIPPKSQEPSPSQLRPVKPNELKRQQSQETKKRSASNLDPRYPFLKRGVSKGVYDDRRLRCAYDHFDEPSNNKYLECHCLYLPYVPSPLRNEIEYLSDEGSDEDEYEADDDSDDDETMEDQDQEDAKPNLSSVLGRRTSIRSRRDNTSDTDSTNSGDSQRKKLKVTSKDMKRFELSSSDDLNSIFREGEDSREPHTPPKTPPNTPTISAKFSQKFKSYHSVNNLSKKASIKAQISGKLDELHHANNHNKNNNGINERPHSSPVIKHKHFRSFRRMDLGFGKYQNQISLATI